MRGNKPKEGKTVELIGREFCFDMTTYKVTNCGADTYEIFQRVRFNGSRIIKGWDNVVKIINSKW